MPNETCKCGRLWTHCRNCGYKAVYGKKIASRYKSQQLGYDVVVYSCQRCNTDTDISMDCVAPSINAPMSDFVPENKPAKPADKRPQFVLVPNTLEYMEAWIRKYNDLADSHKYRSKELIIEAMEKDGWTTPPMDTGEQTNETTMRQPIPISEPQRELSLEEVLEKMKKEQQ